MKSLTDLRKEEHEILNQLSSIRIQIDARLATTLVMCGNNNYGKGCGMASRIGDLVYWQTQWYEPPYGCTGGAQWRNGEGQWDCPFCGHTNRLYDKPDIVELRRLFKAIEYRKDEN